MSSINNTTSKIQKFFSFIEKRESWLLLIAVTLCLLPIWLLPWFVTQDGASHLHNSKVLLNFWQGENLDFYSCCYQTDSTPFPNWTNHFVFANLLRFFSPWLTEKIWLSGYIILFVLCFRMLLRELNAQNSFLIFLLLPFMYAIPLSLGFYNFMLGMALLPGAIWVWLKFENNRSLPWAAILFCSFLLLFFTHLFAFFLAFLAILLMNFIMAFGASERKEDLKQRLGEWFKSSGLVLAISLPCLLLTVYFLWTGEPKVNTPKLPLNQLWGDFLHVTSLVNYTKGEFLWTHVLGLSVGVLFLTGLVQRIRNKKFHASDAFFVVALVVLALFFYQPAPVSGKSLQPARLLAIPWMLIILWLSASTFAPLIRFLARLAGFTATTGLILLRIPEQQIISDGFEEIAASGKYIPERSIMLYISFDHNGIIDEVKRLSPRFWAYLHSGDYLGAEKNLIMLGNYEAANQHFPIHYVEKMNPYFWMRENGGVESQPPYADFMKYGEITGLQPDYILTWCMDQYPYQSDYVEKMKKSLEDNYERVYTSEMKRAVLFKKK